MSADALKNTAEIVERLWLAAEQVALHLEVVKDTIYRWREHKVFPAHNIGRLWKFQLSEVDDWVRTGGADEESEKTGASK